MGLKKIQGWKVLEKAHLKAKVKIKARGPFTTVHLPGKRPKSDARLSSKRTSYNCALTWQAAKD
jgi:hypothetical protein